MKLLDRAEEKKLVKQMRVARLVLGLARVVRAKWVTSLIERYCYFSADRTQRLQVVSSYHGHLLMHLDVHSWVERKILCTGYFERWVDDFLSSSLKPGHVALDVGANSGCHTLVMASAVGQAGRVLAFEPNPRMFDRLQANVKLNRFEHVAIFPMAVSDAPGQLKLFIPAQADYNQGLGSVHRANLEDSCDEVSVETATLDAIVLANQLQRLDLIKIDVEGHELQVFKGAEQTLKKFKPILVFEFSERQWRNAGVTPQEVENFLNDLGYELFVMRRGVTTSIRHGVAEECDLLALPK